MNDLAQIQRLTRGLDVAHSRIAALEARQIEILKSINSLADGVSIAIEGHNRFVAAVLGTPELKALIEAANRGPAGDVAEVVNLEGE